MARNSLQDVMDHNFPVATKKDLGSRDYLVAMINLNAGKRRIRSAVARLWDLEPTPAEKKVVNQILLTLTDLQNRKANGSSGNNKKAA